MYHSFFFDWFSATLTLWGLVGLKYLQFPGRLFIGQRPLDGNKELPLDGDILNEYEKMDFGGNGYNDRRFSTVVEIFRDLWTTRTTNDVRQIPN